MELTMKECRTKLGILLRKARLDQKLSLSETGRGLEHAGYVFSKPATPQKNAATISQWEGGRVYPDPQQLPVLVMVLCVSATDLGLAYVISRIADSTHTALEEVGTLFRKNFSHHPRGCDADDHL